MSELIDRKGILYLEDIPLISEGMCRYFSVIGYSKVTLAKSIEDIERYTRDSRLMLTLFVAVLDHNVIGGTGLNAMRLIKAQNPKLPIISLSTEKQKYGDYNLTRTQSVDILPGILDDLQLRSKKEGKP